MVSIYDFMDYRAFLKARFAEQKRKNPLFSYQTFSKLAGARSVSFLKLVIDGKRNLADDGIRMIVRGFQLTEEEQQYMECLVKLNQAKSHADKDLFYRKLSQNRRFLAARPLTAPQYNLFSHWYYAAILELVRMPKPGTRKDARWLQAHLKPEVGIKEIKKAAAELMTSGLISEDGETGYFRTEAMFASDDEIRSIALVNFHAQMSTLANRAVKEDRPEDREFSSLTVLVSEKTFRRAKEEIQKFRKKLHSILEQEDGAKVLVGQINLQLFKLSRSETI